MRTLHLSLRIAAILVAGLSTSAAAPFCPETVSTQQVGAAPGPGWSVSYSTWPNQLEQVTFYSGPPQDEASLAYDDWKAGKGSSQATWKFPKDERGYWVRCSYRGTTLELSKALPSAVTSCRVVYDRTTTSASGLPAIKSITCQ